jgi:hypothetical protein
MFFRPTHIHSHHDFRPIGGIDAACAGLNGEDRVVMIVFADINNSSASSSAFSTDVTSMCASFAALWSCASSAS